MVGEGAGPWTSNKESRVTRRVPVSVLTPSPPLSYPKLTRGEKGSDWEERTSRDNRSEVRPRDS